MWEYGRVDWGYVSGHGFHPMDKQITVVNMFVGYIFTIFNYLKFTWTAESYKY